MILVKTVYKIGDNRVIRKIWNQIGNQHNDENVCNNFVTIIFEGRFKRITVFFFAQEILNNVDKYVGKSRRFINVILLIAK